jgi:glycosyltransferase involved in cell wall biosynthesis
MSKKWKEQAKPYSNIVFLGSLPREEINQYLGACDIFAFPSFARNEAFGISLAEALYFGKPAVTFAIPGSGVNWVSLNDVSGLIVPNRDTKAYAEAITKLATDPELYNRLSAGAKERAHTYFTEAYFEKSMNEVYDRVLGVSHSPSEGNKQ